MTSRPRQPSRSSIIFRWVLFTAFVAVVAYHVGSGWLRSSDMIDEWFAPPTGISIELASTNLPVEAVTYSSPLGEMDALLVDGTRSQWIVHVHGGRSGPSDAMELVEVFADAGYHQLLIGYRNDPGQPEDPSGRLRYGVTEWMDLEAALAWAEGQGATEIAVVADGSGASIALEHQLKTRTPLVRSFVFESPIVDLGGTIDAVAADESVLGVPVPPTVTEVSKFFTGLRISVNWTRLDYVRRLGSIGVPTLVLHGTDDEVVPIVTSREMEAASSLTVQLDELDGAGHLPLSASDPEVWGPRILAFVADGWR